MSPYDNNSPVLSERRGESGSSPGEQLANVPENYSEVGQETDSWGSKGELLFSSVYYGPFFKDSFLMTHFIFIKKIAICFFQKNMRTFGERGTVLSNLHSRASLTQVTHFRV